MSTPKQETHRAILLARREKGESIRVIARVLDVSVGAVHGVLAEQSAGESVHSATGEKVDAS